MRLAARKSLKVYTEYMGYRNAPFHEEWLSYLQNDFSPLRSRPDAENRILQLWPRGHGKSEQTSINYPSWLIGNNPDININIVTKTATLCEGILSAIMMRIEEDRRYKEIFGELKPARPQKWNAKEFIVKRHSLSNKNPTIRATGLMGGLTGSRADLIICDDIIDEENVRTRTQLEKVDTWFNKVLLPTLYPWGAIIVIGTRWSHADLYGKLLETWPRSIKKAINTEENGEKRALWPEYWNLDKLDAMKNEIGSIYFDCQYQNDPTGEAGDLLQAEWLLPYEVIPQQNVTWYAGVDPALGEGDMQAIATVAYDRVNRQAYLADVWCDRVGFPQFLQKIRELHRVYKYARIYFEGNAFQKVMKYLPELHGLPTVSTNTSKNKETRFITMSSHFQSGRVLVNPKLLTMRSQFYTQWVQFPRGQYDDAPDSVEIVTRNLLGLKQGVVVY